MNIYPRYKKGENGPMHKGTSTVNNIVLVLDECVPLRSWPLGRVLEVYRNRGDGLARSVKVKTRSSVLVQPSDKIVLLEAAWTSLTVL